MSIVCTASQAVGGGFESRILLQKIALQRVVKNMLGRFIMLKFRQNT